MVNSGKRCESTLSCIYTEIFHSRLQCNFHKLLCSHREEKIASCLHGVPAKFAESKIARIFKVGNFSDVVVLPAQDVLFIQTGICTCNGNAVISSNCVAIATKKLQV